jgi:hypothetical protein
MKAKYLFKNYQKPLVKLSNNRFGRIFLGIDKGLPKIFALTPNAIIYRLGRNKFKTVFRCYPLFAKKLAGALTKVHICSKTNAYCNLSQYKGLLNYIGLFEQPRLFPQLFLDEDTFYSGAGDGHIQSTGDANWDTVHDLTSPTGGASGTGTTFTAGVEKTDKFYIKRAFVPIDTGDISGSATITEAVLSLYATNKIKDDENDSESYLAVCKTYQASFTELADGDFEDCGSDNDQPARAKYTPIVTGSNEVDITGISTFAYNDFTLDSTGINWISLTTYSPLGIREGHDLEDSAPGFGNANGTFVTFSASEQSGTSQDPKLTVTYTAATGSAFLAQFIGK